MQSFVCDRCDEPIKPGGAVYQLATTVNVINRPDFIRTNGYMKPEMDLCPSCYQEIDRAFETPPRPTLEGMYKPGER